MTEKRTRGFAFLIALGEAGKDAERIGCTGYIQLGSAIGCGIGFKIGFIIVHNHSYNNLSSLTSREPTTP
jgi:hypothetical protein